MNEDTSWDADAKSDEKPWSKHSKQPDTEQPRSVTELELRLLKSLQSLVQQLEQSNQLEARRNNLLTELLAHHQLLSERLLNRPDPPGPPGVIREAVDDDGNPVLDLDGNPICG